MISPTPSLFEREMHDQIEAAQAAVAEAVRRGDALLEQAARNHLESLVDLAGRNGLTIELSDLEPALAADGSTVVTTVTLDDAEHPGAAPLASTA